MVLVVATPAIVLFLALVRSAHRDSKETLRAITSSPWTDVDSAPARRARVEAVLAVENELLLRLRWESTVNGERGDEVDLVGPSSIAAIVTLSRWRDVRSTVTVHHLDGRYLLHTPQSRLALRASQVSRRAPTA